MCPHSIPLTTRFWDKVDTSGDCWLWTAGTGNFGYGMFQIAARTTRGAHRVAWYLGSGEWPPADRSVLHTCDAPACVRNDEAGTYVVNGIHLPRFGHLFLGTQADNMADRTMKGRAATGGHNGKYTHPERIARGAEVGSAKLTAEQVLEIRALAASAPVNYSALGRQFNVTCHAVRLIVLRKNWRHL